MQDYTSPYQSSFQSNTHGKSGILSEQRITSSLKNIRSQTGSSVPQYSHPSSMNQNPRANQKGNFKVIDDLNRGAGTTIEHSSKQHKYTKRARKRRMEKHDKHSSFDEGNIIDYELQRSSSVPYNTEVNDRYYPKSLQESDHDLNPHPNKYIQDEERELPQNKTQQSNSSISGFLKSLYRCLRCKYKKRRNKYQLEENDKHQESYPNKLKQNRHRAIDIENSHRESSALPLKINKRQQSVAEQEFTNLPDILAEESNFNSSSCNQSRESAHNISKNTNPNYALRRDPEAFPRIEEVKDADEEDEDESFQDKYHTSLYNHHQESHAENKGTKKEDPVRLQPPLPKALKPKNNLVVKQYHTENESNKRVFHPFMELAAEGKLKCITEDKKRNPKVFKDLPLAKKLGCHPIQAKHNRSKENEYEFQDHPELRINLTY